MKARFFAWFLLSWVALALTGCTFELKLRWRGLTIVKPDDGDQVLLGTPVKITVRYESESDRPLGGEMLVRGPTGEASYDLSFAPVDEGLYQAELTWQPVQAGEYTLMARAQRAGKDPAESDKVHITVLETQALRPRPTLNLTLKPATPLPLSSPSPTATRQPTATPTRRLTPTITPSPTATPLPCHRAEFVADVTVPDGTVMQPDQPFTKTWRLRNAGSCTWTPDYAVIFDSGDRMGAAPSTLIGQTVAPGQTVDLSVDLTAPHDPGTYRANFKLHSPDGQVFGLGEANAPFYVEIRVAAQKPDLVVQSIAFDPATPVEGQGFTVAITVANRGNAASGTFGISWLTSPQSHVAYCAWTVNGLAAGASTTVSCPAGIQPYGFLPAGTYTTVAIVDSGRQVDESDEGNNQRTQTLTIAQGDTQGPVIKASRSADKIYWPAGCQPQEVTIRAYVSDPSGVRSVTLLYRVVDDRNRPGQWVEKPFTKTDANAYQVTLTGQDLQASLNPPVNAGEGRVEYFIIAIDNHGNQTKQQQPNLRLLYCLY